MSSSTSPPPPPPLTADQEAAKKEACSACPDLKKTYDNCFHQWYAEFLQGKQTELGCKKEFEQYQECVMKTIESRGLKSEVMEIAKMLTDEYDKEMSSSSSR
eukprot:TRINITY_DN2763_c0_g1_i2.p1 TRINITY_DN2763_c0_g1~~TRINITY_DN2763_c0_g1_i2.p1  ORF type:complete len:102 (-),score=31.26 TRINITY_DN2763_c0_g1_i2:150-455(-)